ncbi:MAG: hypothetical protein WCF30_08560 [Terracidiphilus sp.]
MALSALKGGFRPVAANATVLGCTLEELCYAVADAAAMFLAPFVFCKIKLATTG